MKFWLIFFTCIPMWIIAQEGAVVISTDARKDAVIGNPFVFDTWLDGLMKIQSDYGEVRRPVKIDNANMKVQIKFDGENIRELPTEVVKGVILFSENKTFHFRKYPISGRNEHTLYEVLYDGVFTLLKDHVKSMKSAGKVKNYQSLARSNDEIVTSYAYFIKRPDGTFVEIRLKSKSVLKALSKWENRINPYLQSNNLKVLEEKHVIEILQGLEE